MINFFKKPKILVTHDGSFHADDVFACAILQIYLENIGESFKIIRTRDEEIINKADYVFDVGNIYDPDKNRFDHHQKGRAGARENGIMYAAAGLVWKHFGDKLVKHKEVLEFLDKRIFQPLDSADNGQDLVKSLYGDIFPYSTPSIVSIFNLSWNEKGDSLKQFKDLVFIAKTILKREIFQTNQNFEAQKDILDLYQKSEDKKIVVLDKPYSRAEITKALVSLEEPVYFIYPKEGGNAWKIEALRKTFDSFESRKPFPESWAGLRDEDFQKVSGISDAMFAHDGRFYCVVESKESALELAKLAINS